MSSDAARHSRARRLIDVDNLRQVPLYDSSGTARMRQPKGEYYFDATIALPIPELRDFRTAEFVEPALDLTPPSRSGAR